MCYLRGLPQAVPVLLKVFPQLAQLHPLISGVLVLALAVSRDSLQEGLRRVEARLKLLLPLPLLLAVHAVSLHQLLQGIHVLAQRRRLRKWLLLLWLLLLHLQQRLNLGAVG